MRAARIIAAPPAAWTVTIHTPGEFAKAIQQVERRAALQRAPRPRRARDPNTRAAEERLRAALGARVRIVRRGKGGALRVEFKTEPELHRLYEMLLRAGRGR